MNALRRFEDWIGGFVEGRLPALLGQRLEPVDIARRLAAVMEDRHASSAGRQFVPNCFVVFLAPATLRALDPARAELEGELRRFVGEHAAERGWQLLGPPVVRCQPREGLRREQLRVEARVRDSHGGPDALRGATMAFALPPSAPSAPPCLRLVHRERGLELAPFQDGPRLIGRALDNDLIVEAGSVSRHHARVVAQDGRWRVEDLGSKHGLFLNDRRVISAPLRPGDRLRLGRVVLQVQRTSPDSQARGSAEAADSPAGS